MLVWIIFVLRKKFYGRESKESLKRPFCLLFTRKFKIVTLSVIHKFLLKFHSNQKSLRSLFTVWVMNKPYLPCVK